jgi:hypothetical protein
MSRHIVWVLLATFSLGLAACSSSSSAIYVAPEFSRMSAQGSMIVVMPEAERIQIRDRDHTLVQVDAAAHLRHMQESFVDSLNHYSRIAVGLHTHERSLDLAARALRSGSSQFSISLPEDGSTVEVAGRQPELVLFIDHPNTEWVRRQGEVVTEFVDGSYAPVRRRAAPTETAVYGAYFAIWDNIQGRLLAYGPLRADVDTMMVEEAVTWERAVGAWARQIVNRTPLDRAVGP